MQAKPFLCSGEEGLTVLSLGSRCEAGTPGCGLNTACPLWGSADSGLLRWPCWEWSHQEEAVPLLGRGFLVSSVG